MEVDQESDDGSENVSLEMLAETSNSAAQNDENPSGENPGLKCHV